MTDIQSPDVIAHLLTSNVGSPVRVYLTGEEITVPVEPCRGGTPPTDTVPMSSFEAVIDHAEIVDGGLNLFGIDGIHLPESEWRRAGLEKHWNHEDADLSCPFFPPRRRLEVWASRENTLWDTESSEYSFDHLEGIPDDSPLVTEWADGSPDDEPDAPPVPLERPKLSIQTVRAEGTTDTRGMDQVEVGRIARVEILDDIAEWPEDPEFETEDIDFSPPSRHPDFEYDELEPIPQSGDVLDAVFTINRHAKRLDREGDAAYQRGDGAEARAYSIQKRALYRVKTLAVHRLAKSNPGDVRVVRHLLNGDHEMVCVYIGEHSFHQPLEAVDAGLIIDVAGEDDVEAIPCEEISFESSGNTDNLPLSRDEALSQLRSYGLDANDHRDAEYVEDYTWGYEISTAF